VWVCLGLGVFRGRTGWASQWQRAINMHKRPQPPYPLKNPTRVEAEPQYWPVLRRLLAVGQLEAVGELLLAHPAYAADGGGAQVRAGF
jgi:hypothetical protein